MSQVAAPLNDLGPRCKTPAHVARAMLVLPRQHCQLSCRRNGSSMRLAGAAALLCAVATALLAVVPCSASEPMAASDREPATALPPTLQAETSPDMAAAAAMEAMAKLKAAKADPLYYADFPHDAGASAVSLLVSCDPGKRRCLRHGHDDQRWACTQLTCGNVEHSGGNAASEGG